MPSDLFLSLIMHPAQFPVLCGVHTNTYQNIVINGLDENTVANALGEFLNSLHVNTLYIAGSEDSHGEHFFRDMEIALRDEPEVGFLQSPDLHSGSPHPKKVVRLRRYVPPLPTRMGTHKILRFCRIDNSYRPFDKSDFCCFLYCGNTEDGPHANFRCRNPIGQLCVRRRYGGSRTCGVCFWCPVKKMLMQPFPPLHEEDEDSIDEGCVADPLGVTRQFYRDHFSDTESEPPEVGEEPDSDCDW